MVQETGYEQDWICPKCNKRVMGDDHEGDYPECNECRPDPKASEGKRPNSTAMPHKRNPSYRPASEVNTASTVCLCDEVDSYCALHGKPTASEGVRPDELLTAFICRVHHKSGMLCDCPENKMECVEVVRRADADRKLVEVKAQWNDEVTIRMTLEHKLAEREKIIKECDRCSKKI